MGVSGQGAYFVSLGVRLSSGRVCGRRPWGELKLRAVSMDWGYGVVLRWSDAPER